MNSTIPIFKARSKEQIFKEIQDRKQIRHKDLHTRNHDSIMKRIDAVLKIGEGSALDEILKEVDKTLSVQIFELRKEVMEHLCALEAKVKKIEEHARNMIKWHADHQKQLFNEAKHMVDLERTEKAVLCQWLNGFLCHSKEEPVLDPTDFSFSRFSLNIAAASYSAADPSKFILAGVPAFLVGILSNCNDIVRGPAALALSHLALHDECKDVVAHANGIPPLIEITVQSSSPAVLVQTCKALATLALHFPNKPIIAQRGGLAALIDLVEEGNRDPSEVPHVRVTPMVTQYALNALVNSIHGSDANRTLAVELGIMEPLATCLDKSDDEKVLREGVRVVANVAYGNSYTATKLLQARTDTILGSIISGCDLRALSGGSSHNRDLLTGALLAIGNLANHEMNQSQVGGSSCLALCVTVLQRAKDPVVLRAAGLALGSLAYKSLINKTRCGTQGAIQALLETAERMDTSRSISKDEVSKTSEESSQTAMACCYGLSQIISHPPNQVVMRDINGYVRLVELCENTDHMGTLNAAAMALTALVPDNNEKIRTDAEGLSLLIEECGGLDALVRCKQWIYGRKDLPPWLAIAIHTLQTSPKDLALASQGDFHYRPEIFEHHFLFEEISTVMKPDLEVSSSAAIQELVYRIY